MKTLRTALVVGCCAGALWGCAGPPQHDEDAELTEEVTELLPDQPTDPAVVVAAPTNARTLLANEWVGVADVTLADGELVPEHQAGVRYVYPLTACTVSVVDADSEEIVHMVPGELVTWPAGRLSLANVGEPDAEFLVIERSSVDLPPDLENLPVPDEAIDMERRGTVLLDDDGVLAVDVTLDQLQGDPLPPNQPSLVVALTDCDLEFRGADVADEERVMKAGEAIWQRAGFNVVGNLGDGPARFLVVAFRQ